MLGIFNFGKKKKRSTKMSSFGKKKSRKSTGTRKVKKVPASVLKKCRKLKIKTTVKKGSKRVRKPLKDLMRMIKKKEKALKKKKKSSFGARRKVAPKRIRFGGSRSMGMEFGKKKKTATKKVSKAAAMKAFKMFYQRHCSASSRMGTSRFGSSNPPLSQIMGMEFCPFGQRSGTGLYPTPCAPMNRSVKKYMPKKTSYGRKRRVGRPRKSKKAMEFGKKKRTRRT